MASTTFAPVTHVTNAHPTSTLHDIAMQTIERETRDTGPIPLSRVLITEAMARRISRRPDHTAEAAALHELARALTGSPDVLLQRLVDNAIWLCDAGSAGISLLEPDPAGGERFRWTALAGEFAGFVGATTPREFSPCGVCLDEGRAVLFAYPERRYEYLRAGGRPLVEGLVVPFAVGGVPMGTIWIATHREARRFDLEDVRVMSSLAAFAGAAYAVMQRVR